LSSIDFELADFENADFEVGQAVVPTSPYIPGNRPRKKQQRQLYTVLEKEKKKPKEEEELEQIPILVTSTLRIRYNIEGATPTPLTRKYLEAKALIASIQELPKDYDYNKPRYDMIQHYNLIRSVELPKPSYVVKKNRGGHKVEVSLVTPRERKTEENRQIIESPSSKINTEIKQESNTNTKH